MQVKEKEMTREGFSSGIAVFFATLSSAIGLGNIWRFPYLTGENGGGAFLLVYLICVLLVGLPLMVSEFYIGRRTKKNIIGAFKALLPASKLKYVGFMGVISTYLMMFFYSGVTGWVYSYIYKAIKGDFNNVNSDTAKQIYNDTIYNSISPIIWQAIVLIVVSGILILGVKKGIEKVTKILLPVLFVLIIVCDIRALTLPGASQGINFLLNVDFSKITSKVILAALGLSFFKLSLGMGTMVTYSSYFTKDNNMMYTSARVAFSDTAVSLMAGLAIFPVVFAYGLEPSSGKGLLFMTIPLVFSKMMFGKYLLIAFFSLTAIAGTMSMLSLVEVQVAYLTEEKGFSRKKAVLFSAVLILIFGSITMLSVDQGSLLSGISLFGAQLFGIFEYASSNLLMPLLGLFVAIFLGYIFKKTDIVDELSNGGTLKNAKLVGFFRILIRYVTPVLLIIIFITTTIIPIIQRIIN